MDAFEQIVETLLEEDKYWVRHSVKVELSPREKKAIHKSTTPRPEIDVVAYDLFNNNLYLIEVKSYLDSKGVIYSEVAREQDVQSGAYKLLTCKQYRDTIKKRLLKDWKEKGIIINRPHVRYGLIAGKLNISRKTPNPEEDFKKLFRKKKWLYWGPAEIKQRIKSLSDKKYDNEIVTMIAKILDD